MFAAWIFGVMNHIYKRYAYISHHRHFNIKISRESTMASPVQYALYFDNVECLSHLSPRTLSIRLAQVYGVCDLELARVMADVVAGI